MSSNWISSWSLPYSMETFGFTRLQSSRSCVSNLFCFSRFNECTSCKHFGAKSYFTLFSLMRARFSMCLSCTDASRPAQPRTHTRATNALQGDPHSAMHVSELSILYGLRFFFVLFLAHCHRKGKRLNFAHILVSAATCSRQTMLVPIKLTLVALCKLADATIALGIFFAISPTHCLLYNLFLMSQLCWWAFRIKYKSCKNLRRK